MTESGLMRIGDLAQLTEKTVRALHLYEERGLLKPAARSPGGFRLYDRENIIRIKYIGELQKLGHTLDQIHELLGEWLQGGSPRAAMAQVEQSYRNRLAEVQGQLRELKALEDDLSRSLAFLAGCRPCDAAGEPATACCLCERAGKSAEELTLIRGLTGR